MDPVTTTRTYQNSHRSVRNALIFLGVICLSVLSIIFSDDTIHKNGYKDALHGHMIDVYGYGGAKAVADFAYSDDTQPESNDLEEEGEEGGGGDDDGTDDEGGDDEEGDDEEGNDEGGDDENDGEEDEDQGEEDQDEDEDDGDGDGDDGYGDGDDDEKETDVNAGDDFDKDDDTGGADDEAKSNDKKKSNKVKNEKGGQKQQPKAPGGQKQQPKAPGGQQKHDRDRRKMNVIVLYPDDWRHNSIGSENPIIQTPFLDSLADEGIRFRQNAVTTSICWTSRATLFTGQWASRHQSPKLFCPNFCREKSWNSTWPKLLQDDGYFVGHVGKWQYHSNNKERFDWQHYHEGHHWYPNEENRQNAADDLARDDAIRFLKQRPKDKPFAMTVAFYPPKAVGASHDPGGQWFPKDWSRDIYENITIPEPYNMTHAFNLLPHFLKQSSNAAVGRFNERFSTPGHYQAAMKNMYALITQIDDACRKIIDEVKKQGLYDNTMIIFTTDNGMFHGSHGLAGKWYPYQESIRVPLIIYDPRMPRDKVGTVDDNFTLNVDLAETILGAAGLKPHERMQGRDISDLYLPNTNKKDGPTALEQTPWREEFFYEFTFVDGEAYIPSSHAVVQKKWKYIDFYNYNHEQLFDLEEDPLEFTDVKDRPENRLLLAEMRAKLAKYVKQFAEPEEYQIPCERHNDTYWLSKNPTDT